MKQENDFQQLAVDLALQAGEIMKRNFTLGMKKEWKADDNYTPITVTDKEINQLVLDTINKRYPEHSIIAEEGSRTKENTEYVWVCDPVDGTLPFSHGCPWFTFAIALLKNGEVILGVIYDPISNRLARAIKGEGAFLNDKKISVSSDKKISRTSIIEANCDVKLLTLKEELVKKTSCYVLSVASMSYAGMLVASGEFLADVFEYYSPWDGAATKIIVEEAGGKVTDILGNEQRYDQKINGFVASNGIIHDELLGIIKSTLKTNEIK